MTPSRAGLGRAAARGGPAPGGRAGRRHARRPGRRRGAGARCKRFRSWAPQHRRTRAADPAGGRGRARRGVPAAGRGRGRARRCPTWPRRWTPARRRPPPTRSTWPRSPTWPVRRAGPAWSAPPAAAAERASAEARAPAQAAEEVARLQERSRPSAPGAATSWPRRPRRAGGGDRRGGGRDPGAAGGEGRPPAGRAGGRRGGASRSRPREAAAADAASGAGRGGAPGRGRGRRGRGGAVASPAGGARGPQPRGHPGSGCCSTPWSRRPPALRRELALPPVDRPARRPGRGAPRPATRSTAAERALLSDDPALLDQLLALPQVHLIVDGYNVTKTGYPDLPLEKQRTRLLTGLSNLAARSRRRGDLLLRRGHAGGPGAGGDARAGCGCCSARPGETADELIRRLVRAEPRGRPVCVVSSDREVADGVRRHGARPVSAAALVRRLDRG